MRVDNEIKKMKSNSKLGFFLVCLIAVYKYKTSPLSEF